MPGPNTPYTQLDQQQIIQQCFSESQDRLRVDAEISSSIIAPPGLEVSISAIDDNIAIRNSNNNNELLINPDGSINVNSIISGSSDVNLIKIDGTPASVNNGTADAGTLRVAIASDNTPFSVNVNNFPSTFGVTQSTSPWVVSGSISVSNFPVTQSVTQGTSPWVISGTVTSNIGTTGGLALDSSLTTINTTLGSPFQAGGSIGNTSFGASQVGTWNINNISGTISLPTGAATSANQATIITDLGTINTTLGSPMQNSGGSVTALQGTSPWVISGSVTTSPNVNVHDGAGVSISSTGSSLNVDVTNTIPVSQSGSWSVNVNNGAGASAVNIQDGGNSITVDGAISFTAPQHVILDSGTLTTITNPVTVVNSGTFAVQAAQSGTWTTGRTWTLSSGTDSVNIGNFPATVSVTQSTSPWVVSGTITANAGTGTFLVDGSAHTQPVSGTIAATQSGTWNIGTLTSITNPVAVTQSTSPWVVSGTVSANQSGTWSTRTQDGSGTAITSTGAALDVNLKTSSITLPVSGSLGRTWTLANATDSVTSVPVDGVKQTYSSSITNLVSALTPTDIFTITGSGTKTIRVTQVYVDGTQTTSAVRDVLLIKRSTANSGGTSTTPNIVPHDSNNSAATAVVRAYTANPTLGTAVGTIRTVKQDIEATNLVGASDRTVWEFGNRPSQAIVLRGTSEVLAINLNSVTSPNGSWDLIIEWSEE